jgi:hypothetical protein
MLLYTIIGLYLRNILHSGKCNRIKYIKEINEIFSNYDYIEVVNKIKDNLNKEQIQMLINGVDNNTYDIIYEYKINDISYTINSVVLEYYECDITLNFMLYIINEVIFNCGDLFLEEIMSGKENENVYSIYTIFCFILIRLDKESIKFCSEYLIELCKQKQLYLNMTVEILSLLDLFNKYIDLSYFLDNNEDYLEFIFNRDN